MPVAFLVAWVGHACIWVSVLNFMYGRPFSKAVLKPLRLLAGLVILAFPLLALVLEWLSVVVYLWVCVGFGGIIFPYITVRHIVRNPPSVVIAERTQTLDLWKELGSKLHGDGKWKWVPRLPFNCVYRVDFTELELALPNLPANWNGLSILLLSDLHFHGTPSRLYFERILDEIASRWPTPDLVCLAGDFVDTDTHHTWIEPLLGRLQANETKLAILGNHDAHHEPGVLRKSLAAAGYRVLGTEWEELAIRGERCLAIGHEGPWFPSPRSSAPIAADGRFKWCLSHSPDNFYWGQRSGIDLMLCGHVHGGQIRLPIIGSIFVPSVFGRRFDHGNFAENGTVMVVSRGLSGKEPLRFRCNPQVIRITMSLSESAGA